MVLDLVNLMMKDLMKKLDWITSPKIILMKMKVTMEIMKKGKKKTKLAKKTTLILKHPANLQVKYGNKTEVKRHNDVINNYVIMTSSIINVIQLQREREGNTLKSRCYDVITLCFLYFLKKN